MNQSLISNRIELMGVDGYREMFTSFERELARKMVEIKNEPTRRAGLHSLKSMSYAVGLEELGNKVVDIERMIANGAQIALHYQLDNLVKLVAKEVAEVNDFLRNV